MTLPTEPNLPGNPPQGYLNNLVWKLTQILRDYARAINGKGDVVGPSSAVANNLAAFDGTTGKLLKDSGVSVSGANTGDQNIFSAIAVSGQNNVVADTTSDTLTLAAGSNITITTNATTDTITIAAATGSVTLGTEQATTSGTSIDFTGIPSGTRKIRLMFVGVSTNGTSNWLIQLGDSGGIETSGYLGAGGFYTTSTQSVSAYTAGFGINSQGAANVLHGTVTLTLEDASDFTWTAEGTLGNSASAAIVNLAGSKATSAELDRVRLTTVNGTDAFDAGVINISYST